MTDAILVFTFSPIQPFIAEARRAGDLYAGSHILSELSKAAAQAIGQERLIYPDINADGDTPNKLVARVPYEQAEQFAVEAEEKLKVRWQQFVFKALDAMIKFQPMPDSTWQGIWQRQTNHYWQCFWAYAPYEDNYWLAYNAANLALDAAKRTRRFEQCEEKGLKDTLSGQRSALRLQGVDARKYWGQVASLNNDISPAMLRLDGKERLDALGAVKRWGLPRDDMHTFLSVSSVAAADFLAEAKEQAASTLADYRQAVEALKLFQPRSQNKDWPYDGDLFFAETLTTNRLKDSYHLENPNDDYLKKVQIALTELQKKVGWRPNPYYALLRLDGDGVGELAAEAAKKGEDTHRQFSRSLSQFAQGVRNVVKKVIQEDDYVIYDGGDDVFVLAPVSKAVKIGQALQASFEEKVVGGTASVGIAIVHHLYPLSAALDAAHEAEKAAKEIKDKAAVAVYVLKRSGEKLETRSRWADIPSTWEELIGYFRAKDGPLSARFAYSVADEARIVTGLDAQVRQATLRRLIGRHKTKALSDDKVKELAEQLTNWAAKLDEAIPSKKVNDQDIPSQGLVEVACWLLLARFMAQRGGD